MRFRGRSGGKTQLKNHLRPHDCLIQLAGVLEAYQTPKREILRSLQAGRLLVRIDAAVRVLDGQV